MTRECPNSDQFTSLLAGSVSSDDESWLIAHLDDCPKCMHAFQLLSETQAFEAEVADRLSEDSETARLVRPAVARFHAAVNQPRHSSFDANGLEDFGGTPLPLQPAPSATSLSARQSLRRNVVIASIVGCSIIGAIVLAAWTFRQRTPADDPDSVGQHALLGRGPIEDAMRGSGNRGALVIPEQNANPEQNARHAMFILRGAQDRQMENFDDALRLAPNGGLIEFDADGPFHGTVMSAARSLTLNAAPGRRPVLELRPEDRLRGDSLVQASAPLVVVGFEFRTGRNGPNAGHADESDLVRITETSAAFVNCRFVMESGVAVFVKNGSFVQFKNCEFHCGRGTCVVVEGGRDANIRFDNCIMSAESVLDCRSTTTAIRLSTLISECTVVTSTTIRIDGSAVANSQPPLFDFALRRSIIESRNHLLMIRASRHLTPLLVKRIVKWDTQDVVHSATRKYLTIVDRLTNKPMALAWTALQLKGWLELFGDDPKVASRSSVSFFNPNVRQLALHAPHQIQPNDFVPVELAALPGITTRNLGADANIVGPSRVERLRSSAPWIDALPADLKDRIEPLIGEF